MECMSKVTEEHDSSERIRIPILPPSMSNLIYQRILIALNSMNPKSFEPNLSLNTGYIDVSDGCWRRNGLVKLLRCW